MADNPYAAPSSNVSGTDSYGSSGDVAASTVRILSGTKGWARFLSVMCFIAGGFMILAAVMMLSQSGNAPPEFRRAFGGSLAFIAILYLVMGVVVYILPGIILGGYAGKIGALITNPGTLSLDEALEKQRSFFKYMGILAIIAIAFMIIAFLIGIANASRFR